MCNLHYIHGGASILSSPPSPHREAAVTLHTFELYIHLYLYIYIYTYGYI